MPSSIVIPRTHYRLEVQDGTPMYLRELQAYLGTATMELHHCQRRHQPLFTGDVAHAMNRINSIRLMEVAITMDQWRADAANMGLQLVQYRLHLAPEPQAWHTVFEVHVNLMREDPVPRIVIPDPTGPKIALEKMLSIVSLV